MPTLYSDISTTTNKQSSTSLNPNRPLQPQIPTTSPHKNPILSPLQPPLLHPNVPNTQISPRQRKPNTLRLPGFQRNLLEPPQLPNGSVGNGDI